MWYVTEYLNFGLILVFIVSWKEIAKKMYPWLLADWRKTKFGWKSTMCLAICKVHIIKLFHLLSTSYGPHTLLSTRNTMEDKTKIHILQRLFSSAKRQTMNPRKMSDTKTNMQIIEIEWVTKDSHLVSLGSLCKWRLPWDLSSKKDPAMWAPGGNHPSWRAGHRQSPEGRHKVGLAKGTEPRWHQLGNEREEWKEGTTLGPD